MRDIGLRQGERERGLFLTNGDVALKPTDLSIIEPLSCLDEEEQALGGRSVCVCVCVCVCPQ